MALKEMMWIMHFSKRKYKAFYLKRKKKTHNYPPPLPPPPPPYTTPTCTTTGNLRGYVFVPLYNKYMITYGYIWLG